MGTDKSGPAVCGICADNASVISCSNLAWRCRRCYELEARIEADPNLALDILNVMGYERT